MHDTAPTPVVPAAPIGVATGVPAIRGRETLVRASASLWRVVSPSGAVIGHLRHVDHPLGPRWRAERLHIPTGSFRLVGGFWSADAAVASLRT